MKTAGIVLCGGRSSRMGRPKAWLPFGDEVLLQRTVRILREVVDLVVVVAAPGQPLPMLGNEIAIVRDDREFLGPLNGLAAGLTALEDKAEAAYLSSCDVPFLRPEFVRRVIERMGDAEVCMPDIGGFRHPLAAVYRVNLKKAICTQIDAGQLRPIIFADSRSTHFLQASDFADVDPDMQSLRNVNTPEEYAAALRDLHHAPAGPL
jgi:molybdenum cofactor guanylyltransferase